MLVNLVLGSALMVATTAVHAAFMAGALKLLHDVHAERWGPDSHITRVS